MKARYLAENPSEIEFTMKITMTAAQWEKLRDQLNRDHPSWRLSVAITKLLTDARATFWCDETEGKDGQ